jgi:hypothetical protein
MLAAVHQFEVGNAKLIADNRLAIDRGIAREGRCG